VDNNPLMDTSIDVEALRAKLKAMSRAEVRSVAIAAGLACSTVEKFRLDRIAEPRLSKLQKLDAALREKALVQVQ
jgi:hypothetical protein